MLDYRYYLNYPYNIYGWLLEILKVSSMTSITLITSIAWKSNMDHPNTLYTQLPWLPQITGLIQIFHHRLAMNTITLITLKSNPDQLSTLPEMLLLSNYEHNYLDYP